MTPHRDPLAAALARAEAAEAAPARRPATEPAATPARRWTVRGGSGPLAAIIAINTTSSLLWIAERGWSWWRVVDVVAFVLTTVVWALCFVRRVPVDGGGR